MDRGASSEFIAEILKSSNQPVYLVEAWFDDGTIRMTDAEIAGAFTNGAILQSSGATSLGGSFVNNGTITSGDFFFNRGAIGTLSNFG